MNYINLVKDLFPINRSLTGQGVRKTLAYLKNILPNLQIHDVPTGYKAFDWEVPKEWQCEDAYIADMQGNKIIDFKENNLHLVGYSTPVDKVIDREELFEHLYSLPKQPDLIPYVTSYYKERWGFCIAHNDFDKFNEDNYRVCIKSQLFDGVLNYADFVIPGETDEEIIFTTYICHPSMANNELSGPVVATALAKYLSELSERPRYTYRFIFHPETIGSIVYLSKHAEHLKNRVRAGFVLTCVGDERTWSYMPSRTGETEADRVLKFALQDLDINYDAYSFLQRGSDERQYCSPLIDLPVASVMRSKYGTYPEYHTSADNFDVVTEKGLKDSIEFYKHVIHILETNQIYKPLIPCEPQLGKRGLYPDISIKGSASDVRAMMNVLAYTDGVNDVISLSKICDLDYDITEKILKQFQKNKIISY